MDDRSGRQDVGSLRAVLGSEITTERIIELLEAASGDLTRAIDIYFHQQGGQPKLTSTSSGTFEAAKTGRTTESDSGRDVGGGKSSNTHMKIECKKKRSRQSESSASQVNATKQSRLDCFFVPSPKKDRKPKMDNNRKDHPLNKLSHVKQISPYNDTDIGGEDERSSKRASKTENEQTKDCTVASNNSIDNNCDNHSLFVSFEDFSQILQKMAETTKRNEKLSLLKSFILSIWNREDTVESRSKKGTENCGVDLDRTNANFAHEKARTLTSALELVLGGCTKKPIGVSGSAVSKALTVTQGLSRNQLSKAYRKYGDLGDVAASFFQKRNSFFVSTSSSKRSRRLSILQVSRELVRLSETDGSNAKISIVQGLLQKCESRTEIRMIVRLLIANMRIGANMKTVLTALAMVVHTVYTQDSSSTKEDYVFRTDSYLPGVKDVISMVQKTHDLCPDLHRIIFSLLEGGLEKMKADCTIEVLCAIRPMLAHAIHGIDEIADAMSSNNNKNKEMIMEWKYDGMRCQAHYDGSTMKLFSRHMLEITEQFPDVVKNILDAYLPSNRGETTLSSFIIDSEIVGVEGGNFLPFQDLSTRRKKNGSLVEGDVKVKVFVFDLMYLNGTSCVDAPLYKRKQMLHQSFKPTEKFDFVQSKILTTYDEEVINSFFKGAVEKGTEGLMLKQLGCENGKDDSMVSTETESSYEAGTRSRNWLKMKRDYVEGYADTIDVVPIGAWYGNGRKAQKSFLSPVLLAVYDDEEDIFRSVSRCMSFTDKMYESMKRFYFYGTPYPEDADGRNVEKGSSVDDNVDSKEQDVDDGKHDQGTGQREWLQDDEDESEEAGEYVNCFPSRPSSFHISTNEKATIWFKPLEVFEVSFADLTLSRVHTAAAGLVDDEGRGVALRFPRFRRRRPDKKPEQATTSSQIAQMFARQTKTKPGNDG